jgi:hypothetical protein
VVNRAVEAIMPGLKIIDGLVDKSLERLGKETWPDAGAPRPVELEPPGIHEIGCEGIRSLAEGLTQAHGDARRQWQLLKPFWRIASHRPECLDAADQTALRATLDANLTAHGLLGSRVVGPEIGEAALQIGANLRTGPRDAVGREIRLSINDELAIIASRSASQTAKEAGWGRIGILLAADKAFAANGPVTGEGLLSAGDMLLHLLYPKSSQLSKDDAEWLGLRLVTDIGLPQEVRTHLLNGMDQVLRAAAADRKVDAKEEVAVRIGDLRITPAFLRGARVIGQWKLGLVVSDLQKRTNLPGQDVIALATAVGNEPGVRAGKLPSVSEGEGLFSRIGANSSYTVGTRGLGNALAVHLGAIYPDPIGLDPLVVEAWQAWHGVARAVARDLFGVPVGAMSRLVPGGGLGAHELAGGHTLLQHVCVTDAQLAARLLADPGISAASSFTSQAVAESSIAEAIDANQGAIKTWLAGTRKPLEIKHTLPGTVGRYIPRGGTAARDVSSLQIHFRRDPSCPTGYLILTAYPIP